MSILNFTRLVVYRFHEKGLEIFLVNSDLAHDPDVWKLPECCLDKISEKLNEEDFIEVAIGESGESKLIAVEGDWHHIPSIRGLLKHDIKIVKKLVKSALPGIKNGAFFAFKEGAKKIMPSEHKAMKELKEILVDRNSLRNM